MPIVIRIYQPLELLEKAKYTKRWKGSDGKWRYEYGKPTGRESGKAQTSKKKKSSQDKSSMKMGDYTITRVNAQTSSGELYEITGNGRSVKVWGKTGAEKIRARFADMDKLGYGAGQDDAYIEHKNREYSNAQAEKDKKKESALKQKEDALEAMRKRSPIRVDMSALDDLTPMMHGKAIKALNKEYNTSLGIKSLRDIIESGKYVSKETMEVSKVKFNRTKFNRMNYAEQKEYEKKLNEKKTIYTIQTATNAFIEVPGIVYGLIKMKGKTA